MLYLHKFKNYSKFFKKLLDKFCNLLYNKILNYNGLTDGKR